MTRRGAWRALFVFVGSTSGLVTAGGQAPPPSLTPGAAAALVLPKGQWDRDRLTSAIGDPDPLVRSVAARVAAMQIRTDLAPALSVALSQEPDRLTASEQARTILLLQRDAAIGNATAAASRLGGRVVLVVAEWFARNNPAQFATRLPGLLKGLAEFDAIARIAALAVQQTPARLDEVTQALLDVGSPEAWRNYLGALVDNGLDASAPLSRGLTGADADLRAVSWWFVLSSSGSAESMKPAVSAALAAEVPREAPWSRVARELVSRRLNKTVPVDQSAVFREHLPAVRSQFGTLSRLPELTKAERLALRTLLGNSFPADLPAPRAPVPARPRMITARNVTPIVPGLLKSVFDVTGCKTSRNYDFVMGARMSFRADGRPREIGIDATRASAGCGEALRILANLSVAERDEAVAPDRPVWLVLPTEASTVACIDEPPAERFERTAIGGIEPPGKTRNVNPQYPPSAQQARIQGVVAVEAVISSTGCIASAAVTRGVDISLDIESLRAVTQWRYTPTLLDGQPVPVIMTVTVNYALQ
jgi:TonB family protein